MNLKTPSTQGTLDTLGTQGTLDTLTYFKYSFL